MLIGGFIFINQRDIVMQGQHILFMSDDRKAEFNKFHKNMKYGQKNEVQYIPNAIIKAMDNKKTCGVFDEHLNPVPSAEIRWSGDCLMFPQDASGINAEKIPYIDKDVIYLGTTVSHFGHFLINTLDRAWPLTKAEYRDVPIVMIAKHNYREKEHFKLLEYLGVKPENIIILRKTTRFRNVIVPSRAFINERYASADYVNVFRTISNNIGNGFGYDKIYLSRTKFAKKDFGEERLEQIFQKNGYKIIYPETLSIIDQIKYIKDAHVMAGLSGSAMHLALFAPDGATVACMNRSKQGMALIQVQINEIKNACGIYADAGMELQPVPHFTSLSQIVGVTPYVCEMFDAMGINYSAQDIGADKRAWRYYLIAQRLNKLQNIKSKFIYKHCKHICQLLIRLTVWNQSLAGKFCKCV